MNQDQQSELPQLPVSPPRKVLSQIELHPLVKIGTSNGICGMRVQLPGVRDDYSEVKFTIRPDGLVSVEGIVTDSEILEKLIQLYQLNVEETDVMSGHFCLLLKFPEAIEPKPLIVDFKPNANLEIVFRKQIYGNPRVYLSADNNAQV